MHIGLVTGEYPPDQGGVGDFTSQLGRVLAELGHRVHVITGTSITPNSKSQKKTKLDVRSRKGTNAG